MGVKIIIILDKKLTSIGTGQVDTLHHSLYIATSIKHSPTLFYTIHQYPKSEVPFLQSIVIYTHLQP